MSPKQFQSDCQITPDLLSYSAAEFSAWLDGFTAGRMGAFEERDRLADQTARACHVLAVRIVHAMAEIPTHEELERRRRTYSIEGAA